VCLQLTSFNKCLASHAQGKKEVEIKKMFF